MDKKTKFRARRRTVGPGTVHSLVQAYALLGVWTVSGERFLRAAYAYLYIRDFDRAAKAFESAIESDPDNPQYYFHASITEMRSEHYDRALALAQTAARLSPENELFAEHVKLVESTILTVEGERGLENGHLEEARERFQSALQYNPLNQTAADALERIIRHEARPDAGTKPDLPRNETNP